MTHQSRPLPNVFCGMILVSVLYISLMSPLFAVGPITTKSLLDEMVDRNAITFFPEPSYTCHQASSYDRASKSSTENWFANGDTAQFVRDEMNGDRKEWVLMDVQGPGAVTRWWITAPRYRTTIRVYLDGNTTPEIELPSADLIGGNGLVDGILSAEKARGRNLYLPIPYSKSIKITADKMRTGDRDTEQGNLYYQINYRTYSEGTAVESFRKRSLSELSEKIANVQKTLLAAGDEYLDLSRLSFKQPFKDSTSLEDIRTSQKLFIVTPPRRVLVRTGNTVLCDTFTCDTPQVIETMIFRVEMPGIAQPVDGELSVEQMKIWQEKMAKALRSTVLSISFDGKETVWCPLGDFFGSGVGVNPYKSWYTRVDKDGGLISLWRMPFQKEMKLSVTNYGDEDVQLAVMGVKTSDYKWNDRSMYFNCKWRQERNIATLAGKGTKDWNYLTVVGSKGVFVGDCLSILNRDTAWWGEGDEKIYVDGETFPSHFGTGTEDYYGYAWCTPAFFESPFHAQPRAEGPNNFGHATNLRVRLLDGIPFTKDFRFDMEVWHWAATDIDYAVATQWYAMPEESRPIAEVKETAPFFTPPPIPKVSGLTIKTMPTGGNVQRQSMTNWKTGKWRNDSQLWWTGGKVGNTLELTVDTDTAGTFELVAGLTKAIDYGTVQFSVNGRKVGEPLDMFHETVIPTGNIVVGEISLEAGSHTVSVEIVGKNAKSLNYMVGIETLLLKKK